jgi:hypothetical protein
VPIKGAQVDEPNCRASGATDCNVATPSGASSLKLNARFDQSYLIPESFTTGPQRSASLRMNVPNSALGIGLPLDGRIGKDFRHFALQLIDDDRRGAFRSYKAEPNSKFVEVG